MSEIQAIVARWQASALSTEMALMQLLAETEDVAAVEAAVRDHPTLAAHLDQHRAGCERIAHMLQAGVDSPEPAADVDSGIAFARRLFDWSVAQNPETSVALYSLGSPEVLARATAEVLGLLDAWDLLAADAHVVEIGCGIGRLLVPLAARVAAVTGLDVAPGMVAEAQRRCATLGNVLVQQTEGRDLTGIGDASQDLVLAVDCFPYLVQAGDALAAGHVLEVARVLRPGGAFALLQVSYRGDPTQDCADVARWAAAAGLEVEVAGERPLPLWDALVFRLRK